MELQKINKFMQENLLSSPYGYNIVKRHFYILDKEDLSFTTKEFDSKNYILHSLRTKIYSLQNGGYEVQAYIIQPLYPDVYVIESDTIYLGQHTWDGIVPCDDAEYLSEEMAQEYINEQTYIPTEF